MIHSPHSHPVEPPSGQYKKIDNPLNQARDYALASRLRALMKEKGLDHRVTVRNFHGWCGDQLRQYGIPRPNYNQFKGTAYVEELEKRTLAAVEAGTIPTGQYGAVMVDEGHDFAPEWLKLVAQMVNPETDSLRRCPEPLRAKGQARIQLQERWYQSPGQNHYPQAQLPQYGPGAAAGL